MLKQECTKVTNETTGVVTYQPLPTWIDTQTGAITNRGGTYTPRTKLNEDNFFIIDQGFGAGSGGVTPEELAAVQSEVDALDAQVTVLEGQNKYFGILSAEVTADGVADVLVEVGTTSVNVAGATATTINDALNKLLGASIEMRGLAVVYTSSTNKVSCTVIGNSATVDVIIGGATVSFS